MTRKNRAGRSDRSDGGAGPGKVRRVISDTVLDRRAMLAALGAGTAGVLGVIGGDVLNHLPFSSEGEGSHTNPLNLVPEDDVTHRAVRTGKWSDPAVWDGSSVPDDGARVLIEPGVTVTLAHEATSRLKTVRIDGTLAFNPTVDTRLRVDTLVTNPESALKIGSSEEPIRPDVTARLSFVDLGPIDEEWDPSRLSRGLIAMGDLTVHGNEKTAWTTLARAPVAGDSAISLAAAPTNWQPGDRLVIPGVVPNDEQDEERTVASVDDSTVTLDSPLQYDHVPPKPTLDSYALNLSRNVVFESESTDLTRRGHIIILSPETDVRYALLDELGRTNKDQYLTNPVRGEENLPDGLDPNPAARYPFHYHLTGIEASPHLATGLVVDGGPGWGIVNHHAHARITDSVTYDVLGSGFVAEGGNERGSFERNFALRSKGSGERIDSRAFGHAGGSPEIDDLGHAGHGFWFQSPLVKVIDNVAAGHRHYAFAYWTRPLLEGSMAECSAVDDSRVAFCPNLPLEYVDADRPLHEAIEEQRFKDDTMDTLARDSRKINSTFAPLERFEGNEAFASAGGIDVSRNHFKWKHERFSDFSVIDDFTVYNLGPHVDENGIEHGVTKDGAKKGGNMAVKLRYVSNVTLRNCWLIGDGTGVGVPFHDYLWTLLVEDSTIEGWEIGIAAGEHRLTWVRNNTFVDNEIDANWRLGCTGPLVFDGNSFDQVDVEVGWFDVKAPELFLFHPKRGVRIDGRSAYLEEQRPDYVPVDSVEKLAQFTQGNDYGQMGELVDNPEAVVGLTNRELMDRFGISVGGKLLPDNVASEAYLTGGYLEPDSPDDPPESTWLDATDAGGGSFEVVSREDAANNDALRCTGSSSPKSDTASIDFECAAGTYQIYARIWPDSWNGDTVYYRIDSGEWLASEKMKPSSGFRWFAAAPRNAPPYEVALGGGRHTLEIACGNSDVLIDEILVTADGTVVGGYGESTRRSRGT